MKKIKLLTPILVLPTFASTLIPLTSCSNKNVVQEADFATDSWDNLINCANKGIKALVDRYKPRGGTFVITPTDITQEQIAAKTRTIHIDGYGDFKVRVVGECIDKIDDNTNAALTFEFSEIITKDCFHDSLSATNPSSYANSHLRAKLSEILNCFPTVVKNNIKTIKQTTAVINDTHNYDQVVSDEKLFVMTLDEVYGVVAQTQPEVIDENYCYQHYQYSTHQLTSAHIKQYFNPITRVYENCNYWLRTPIILESGSDKTQCYTIDTDGFFTNSLVTESVGISPCFCLGSEQNGIINIGVSAPGFEVCSSQIVNTNENIVVKIKSKQYQGKDVLKLPEANDEGKAEFRIFNEDGRVYSDDFRYSKDKGEVTFVQNRINKSLVFEMWHSQILLDNKTFVALCQEDEKNDKHGNLVLNYLNIGNWFNIKLDNVDYKVNIIDIDHDDIGASKKAVVTLEFYDVFSGYKWDDNGNVDYKTSTINQNLNGTASTSIVSKLNAACPDLASAIKTTYKNVFVNQDNEWTVEQMATKLFILSDDEYLGTTLNHVLLGKPYRFYSESEDRDEKSRGGKEVWTRSPNINAPEEEKQIFVYRIEMGHLITDPFKPTEEYIKLAPAFCI